MQVNTKTRIIEQQAAIDTICDHCSGIFDLNDGVVNLSGNILCPECICADLLSIESHVKQGEYAVRDTEHVHIYKSVNH